MAENKKKSHAEKAASAKGGKNKSSKENSKKSQPEVAESKTIIPPRVISSVLFLALFVLMLVSYLKPEGLLLQAINNVVYGMIGRVGYIVSIPVMLYLFYIHAFSGKRPVRMRTINLLLFLFACGCLGHIAAKPEGLSGGFELIKELYHGGASGATGGVLSGLAAMGIRWICGPVISWIVVCIVIVITLLAGMQFTIPSIIRAVQNRPKLDWEEEEENNKPEPAEVVVNKIVTKQNEQKERRRIRAEQMVIPEVTEPEPKRKILTNAEKKKEIIRQLKEDIDAPVITEPSAPVRVEANDPKEEEVIVPPVVNTEETSGNPAVISEVIPENMPPLDRDAPIPEIKKEIKAPQPKKVKVTTKETEKPAVQPVQESLPQAGEAPAYCFPPIDLLAYAEDEETDSSAEMQDNTRRLNETLASFKIDARIVNVIRGPSVTRYDVELAKGVRLGKLTSATDDIALSLGAVGVRIAAVPGKISVVGIEVPNRSVRKVYLREVIDSSEFTKASSKTSFSVGKDISGSCIIGNIAKMPHMLIAGTTGSGKSVCTNSIIISILYKASPDDVKLIMVDPKMVELGIYNGIPHLLIPVVTDPKKAAGSLQWAVTEMMRRYKAMSDEGVRDLESYNSIMESQETGSGKMPQIVVIIDELADLMMVAAKEVEESICRIAQMGRAAGIHLIIATQRPSSDVITGTMKANIPSRIAFAVASALESRIILDTTGAEKLVGKGDMLYAPIGTGKPRRVQGCFVTDSEVEAVTTYVKNNFASAYDQQIIKEIEDNASNTGNKSGSAAQDPMPTEDEMAGDEMLPAAVDVILETGQASVSMLQRRLKLGYARAARIVDEMEEKKIVGPYAGSKPRAILITKEQWQAMRGDLGGDQMDFSDFETDATEYPVDDDF